MLNLKNAMENMNNYFHPLGENKPLHRANRNPGIITVKKKRENNLFFDISVFRQERNKSDFRKILDKIKRI